MPEDKLPVSQFAANIKAKYPQYKDMDDMELTKKIIEKFPVYADQVDLGTGADPLKKKDGITQPVQDSRPMAVPSNAGTSNTSPSSSSSSQSQRNPVSTVLQAARKNNGLGLGIPQTEAQTNFLDSHVADAGAHNPDIERKDAGIVKRVADGDVTAIADVVKQRRDEIQKQIDSHGSDLAKRKGEKLDLKSGSFFSDNTTDEETVSVAVDGLRKEDKDLLEDASKVIESNLGSRMNQELENANGTGTPVSEIHKKYGAQQREAFSKIGKPMTIPGVDDDGYVMDKIHIQEARPANKREYEQKKEYKDEWAGIKASLTDYSNQMDKLKSSNPNVAKFVEGTNEDRDALIKDPGVQKYLETYQKAQSRVSQINNLYKKYPIVSTDFMKQQIRDASMEIYQHKFKNLFTKEAIDTETEFKALKEALNERGVNLSDEQIMKHIEAGTVPPALNSVAIGFTNTMAGLDQWVARKFAHTQTQADAMADRINDNWVYHSPEKLQVGKGGWSVDNIVRTMGDGFGQFAAFSALTLTGEGTLGVAAKGLVRGASALERVGVLSGATEIPGIGRLIKPLGQVFDPELAGAFQVGGIGEASSSMKQVINAASRARTLASTYATGYASSWENAYQEAKNYSDDPNKWEQYATADAFFNGISELILPDIDVARKAAGVLAVKKLLQAGYKEGIQYSNKELLKAYLGEAMSIASQETLEEYIPLIGDAIAKQKIFNYNTSTKDFLNQLYDTTVQTVISTIPMAFFGAHGVNTSNLTKSTIYEMAELPEKHLALVDQMVDNQELSPEAAVDRKKMINTAARIRKELPLHDMKGRELDEETNVNLTSALFANDYYTALSDRSPVAEVLYKDKVDEIRSTINKIMKGEFVSPTKTTNNESKDNEAPESKTKTGAEETQRETAQTTAGEETNDDLLAETLDDLEEEKKPRVRAAMNEQTGQWEFSNLDETSKDAATDSQEEGPEESGSGTTGSAGQYNNDAQEQQQEASQQAADSRTDSVSGGESGAREAQETVAAQPQEAKWRGIDNLKNMAEQDPAGFLNFIADQATNGRYDETTSLFGEDFVDKAIKFQDNQLQNEETQNQNRQDGQAVTGNANTESTDNLQQSQGQEQSRLEGTSEAEVDLQSRLRAIREQKQGEEVTMQDRLAAVRGQMQQEQKKTKKIRAVDKKAAALKKKGFHSDRQAERSAQPAHAGVTEEAFKALRDSVMPGIRETVHNWQQGNGKLSKVEFIFALREGLLTFGDFVYFYKDYGLKLSKTQQKFIDALLKNKNNDLLMDVRLEFDKYLDASGVVSAFKRGRTATGKYVYDISDITLSPELLDASDNLLYDIALHEFLHRVTIKKLAEDKEFRKAISQLREQARKEGVYPASGPYREGVNELIDKSMENDYEFVAGFYSYSSFRNFLERIDKKKTVLDKIVDFINKWLFGKEADNNLRDHISRILSNYIAKADPNNNIAVTEEDLDNFQSGEKLTADQIDSKLQSVKDRSLVARIVQAIFPNAGFHRGTLHEKSDYLQSGYYGDMPFTGYYFISNAADVVDGGSRRGDPKAFRIVDFSKYNLFKPTTEEYWAVKSGLKGLVKALFDGNSVRQAFEEAGSYSHLGMFKTWSPKLVEQLIENADEIQKQFEEWKKIELSGESVKERFETVMLKALGYEGVDVRGLKEERGTASPDTFSHGSVIFDLKPDTVTTIGEAYKKAKEDNSNSELVNLVDSAIGQKSRFESNYKSPDKRYSRELDALKIAREYHRSNLDSIDEFLSDRDLLNLYNKDDASEWRDRQRDRLKKIFYSNTGMLQQSIDDLEQAIKEGGDIPSNIKRYQKQRAEKKNQDYIDEATRRAEKPRYRVTSVAPGKFEQVNERERSDEEVIISDLKNFIPYRQGESWRQAQLRDLKMGVVFEDEFYKKSTYKLAGSAARMDQFITNAFVKLGADRFLLMAENIMKDDTWPRKGIASLNMFGNRFQKLGAQWYSPEVMAQFNRDMSILGTEGSEGLSARRGSNEEGMDIAEYEVFTKTFEDASGLSEAAEILDNTRRVRESEDWDSESDAFAEGMSDEEADAEIEDLIKEQSRKRRQSKAVSIDVAKAKNDQFVKEMRAKYDIKDERVEAVLKGVADGLKNRLKKLKC